MARYQGHFRQSKFQLFVNIDPYQGHTTQQEVLAKAKKITIKKKDK